MSETTLGGDAERWLQLDRDVLTALTEEQPQRALSVIGERLDWDLGVLWERDPDRECLVARSIWTADGLEAGEFVELTSAARLAPGEGQPGEVWDSLQLCWRTHFDHPSPFIRAESARRARMRSGIWVPLQASDGLVGVLELLRRSDREPPPVVLDGIRAIGQLVAIYLRGTALQRAAIAGERRLRAELERQVADRTRELAASQARLERFFSSDIIGMFVGTFDGVTLEANREFLRIIGYTATDVAAGAVRQDRLDLAESSPRDAIARQQLLETGIASAYEKELVRKDGTRVPVVLGAARLGDSPTVICFVLDNTRRKQVERDLANLNERLEGLFLERTAELHASQAETAASERRLRSLTQRLMKLREDTGIELAREIHDVLGSELTGLKMDVSWVLRRLAAPVLPASEVTERLSGTIHAVDRMVSTVRRIATELRPSALDDLGLVATLRWWAREFAKRSALEISIDAPEHVPMSPEASTALFRVTQELLTNVARHAGANYVEVSLASLDDAIELRVRDDGVGIQRAPTDTSLGLTGVRERVLALSGSFEIGRGDVDGGTVAVVRIPTPLEDAAR